jgi:hypothetical protein
LKYWKFSENDEKVYKKWDDFVKYIDKMLKTTNYIKWNIIDADDEREVKLDVMKAVLDNIDYEDKINDLINLDKIKKKDIVFLDLDGVLIPYNKDDKDRDEFFLHTNKWSKEAIRNMNKLIKKLDAEIVLISTQGRKRSKKEIEKKFKQVGFDYELFDEVNYNDARTKGVEIEKWINKNKDTVKNFVIIDDHKQNFKEYNLDKCWVNVKSDIGFTKDDMKNAIDIIDGDNDDNYLLYNVINGK